MDKASQSVFQPVVTQKVCTVIFEQIRGRILTGQLKAGDRLPSEQQLMEAYGRSRPTIREALRMLERERYIKIAPGSGGAVVQELTYTALTESLGSLVHYQKVAYGDLFEFRYITETAYARLAALRREPEDVAALERVIEKAENCHDLREFFALDVAFHEALVHAAKNQMSCIINQVIHPLINEVVLVGFEKLGKSLVEKKRREILDNHNAIKEAVELGDPVLTQKAVAEHISHFRDF